MRTFKFRGKSKDDGCWIYGTYQKTDNNINNPHRGGKPTEKHTICSYFSGDWNLGGWDNVEIDINTLGQFTGLLDKNKREIYEGDWLITDEKDMIIEVWYSVEEGCWIGEIINPISQMVDLLSNFKPETMTIFGNKFDSLDLLNSI